MKKSKSILGILALAAFVVVMGCKKEEDTPADPEPEVPVVPAAYIAASAKLGGIMYDKFWASQANYDLSSANITKFNAFSDFFRCKQCHGWDNKGSLGAYINRGPKTNRPNVSPLDLYNFAKGKTEQELFDGMKRTTNRRDISYDLAAYNPTTNAATGDQMPNYNQLLTDAQIWDLVKFMKQGAFDVTQLYDATFTGSYPSGTASFSNIGRDGDAVKGNTFYASECTNCHGTDGKKIPNLDATTGMTVGKFTRSKPNELQHKIHYGQLGSSMLGDFDMSLAEMKDLYKALADKTQYPD